MVFMQYKKNMQLFIILLMLIVPFTLSAEETGILENELLAIRYDRSLYKVAVTVQKIYPSVKSEIEATFGADIDFRPTVQLIKSEKRFQDSVIKGPVVAVAISAENRIVIDNSKMKTYPFSLAVTLKHELCHLFLHNYVGDGTLPRWLNEGISQWASDGIAEIMIVENRNVLKEAILSRRLLPLSSLQRGFPQDEKLMNLAYEESKSIVEYIVKEYGKEGIITILNGLRKGDSPARAVEDSLSVSVVELEDDWHDYLRTRNTWLIYVSSHIYQFLFAFTAIILVYGFIKFQIRKNHYKDDEDEFGEQDEEE